MLCFLLPLSCCKKINYTHKKKQKLFVFFLVFFLAKEILAVHVRLCVLLEDNESRTNDFVNYALNN